MRNTTGFFILAALVVSFLWPTPGEMLQPILQPLLMALMFLSCLDVRIRQTITALRQWRTLLALLAVIHLLSPFLILLVRPWLDPGLFVGWIIAAAMSSGMATVFLSQLLGGDASRALVGTTISQVISPVVVPAVTWVLVGTVVAINPWVIGETIAKLVLIPIAAAVIVRKLQLDQGIKRLATPVSVGLLVLLIMGVVAPVRITILDNPGLALGVGVGVFALVVINGLVGYRFGRTRTEKITASVVASYKNYTLSMVVALSLFGPLAALPSIMYTIINNLLLFPAEWWLRTHR